MPTRTRMPPPAADEAVRRGVATERSRCDAKAGARASAARRGQPRSTATNVGRTRCCVCLWRRTATPSAVVPVSHTGYRAAPELAKTGLGTCGALTMTSRIRGATRAPARGLPGRPVLRTRTRQDRTACAAPRV